MRDSIARVGPLHAAQDHAALRRRPDDAAADVLEQHAAVERAQAAAHVRLTQRDVASTRLQLDRTRDPPQAQRARLHRARQRTVDPLDLHRPAGGGELDRTLYGYVDL